MVIFCPNAMLAGKTEIKGLVCKIAQFTVVFLCFFHLPGVIKGSNVSLPHTQKE